MQSERCQNVSNRSEANSGTGSAVWVQDKPCCAQNAAPEAVCENQSQYFADSNYQNDQNKMQSSV